jgi:two-component system, OmpR family, sensor histidine kinase BaeS
MLDSAFNNGRHPAGQQGRRRELLADFAHELRTPIATIAASEGIQDGRQSRHRRHGKSPSHGASSTDIDSVSRDEEWPLNRKLRPTRSTLTTSHAEAVTAADAGFADKGVSPTR